MLKWVAYRELSKHIQYKACKYTGYSLVTIKLRWAMENVYVEGLKMLLKSLTKHISFSPHWRQCIWTLFGTSYGISLQNTKGIRFKSETLQKQ